MSKFNIAKSPCRILIVEDSRTQAQRLKFLLEQEGCTVIVSDNGIDALEQLKMHRPEIVISDVVMPRMDGFELCRKIKDDPVFRDVPVVLLTSLVNPGDIIKGLEAGASNFITKPYEREYLFSCINAIMMNRALEAHEGMRVGIDVYFSGSRHTITAERKQILGLLLNTFETAVHKNGELLKKEAELRNLNEQLEEKVRQRTQSLSEEVAERRRLEENHAALARKLELVLNSAGEGIFGMTADYTCTFANATAAELLKYPQQDLTGLNMRRFWATSSDNTWPFASEAQPCLEYQPADVRNARATFVRADGTSFPVRYTASQARKAGNHSLFMVITFMDITEELAAEQKVLTQLGRLDALHKIDIAITASLDLRITLETVLKMCQRELNVDAAAIYLMDERPEKLQKYVTTGFKTESIEERPVLSRDCVTDLNNSAPVGGLTHGNLNSLLAKEQFTDYYKLPLFLKGEPHGIIELFSRTAMSKSSSWIEYAKTLARHAMIAIDNHQLLARLEQSNADLRHAYEATIEGWSRALDLRDRETEGHTQRVAAMTVYLARRMGYHDEQLVHVRRGALLHDIGKMGIPDSILLKPGPLTPEEWEIMKKHPQAAYDLLYPITYLRPALDIPYCHHERWDGTGYPRGLSGEQIPKAARLFAVADIWDALQSDRPYRRAWPASKIRDHIRSLSGTHLEPAVVDAFLQIDLQKIGASLENSNDEISADWADIT